MIEAQGIDVHYGDDVHALKGVSLACSPGTFTGIVGPNGSGKTTLIKALAGLLAPSKGDVMCAGEPLGRIALKERARRIAYVPQDTHMPFPFTAFEVVLMGRAPHIKALSFEGAHDLEIARAAMAATETSDFADRGIHELSGGERQRVILARALAQQARIMLLDEPTASLDIKHRISFYRLVTRACREESMTAVATMHDLNIAALFCDRIVMLKDGRVISHGTPRDVFNEENLIRTFGVQLRIMMCEQSGAPFIIPILEI